MTICRNDNTSFKFCRSKCKKLFKRRVNPRKTKWTKIYIQIRGKELSDHPIYGYEKRRDEILFYDRNKMESTVGLIPNVIEKRSILEDIYVRDRILQEQVEHKERDLQFIERYERLLEKNNITTKNNNITTKNNNINSKSKEEYEIN